MSGVVVGVVVLLGVLVAAAAAMALRRRTWPETPAFARPRPVTSPGGLAPDPNAGFFTDRGFLFRKRHFFVGTGCPPALVPDFPSLDVSRREQPVRIARHGIRAWWWFEDEFYREAVGLGADDVLAWVRERDRRRRARQDRARLLSAAEESLRKRENG
ncbi:hypothetical protein ALI22I_25180 [Saccharothrix sp. ALI-22-I]|uniref:hypothetical protein n=1 Tax=Saccharothrix sp. ALI-22-I TaxID=1933778 RepID=UPI00097C2E46|nr:hypothetical protein [Saccharothrix sp. ALI-22-I]ONI86040.1 hypothetical protein ALI22I_25180 [Saccharothrix sp. ALI-22-I]